MRIPAGVPRAARATWTAIDVPTVASAGGAVFEASSADGLPDATARWLRRAVEAGAVLARGARITMHGEIRVGSWRRFTAHQVIAPGGFVWVAHAGSGPVRISGYDRYRSGVGEMRWRLFGLVPVMRGFGADVSRSAAGRFAGESLVFTPAVALDATWREEPDGVVIATVDDGFHTHDIELDVDDGGRPASLSFTRWGDPNGDGFAAHTFHVALDGEIEVDGQRIPASMRAAWRSDGQHGSPDDDAGGEFFRATIDSVERF